MPTAEEVAETYPLYEHQGDPIHGMYLGGSSGVNLILQGHRQANGSWDAETRSGYYWLNNQDESDVDYYGFTWVTTHMERDLTPVTGGSLQWDHAFPCRCVQAGR